MIAIRRWLLLNRNSGVRWWLFTVLSCEWTSKNKEEIISILKNPVTEFDLYGDGVLIIISIPEYFEGTSKKS